MSELILERGELPYNPVTPVMLTPDIDPDYWSYRVRLTDKQAVVGFVKFGVIGIGFAEEPEDWNRNLPSSCDTTKIAEHIWLNRGDDTITREQVLAAIKLIQDAVVEDKS